MQKLQSQQKKYIQSILIVIVFVLGLLGIYVHIMQVSHQKNVNHLTQSLTEIEQSKLKNKVNELMIKIEVDNQYMNEGYNRMLDVVEITLHQLFNNQLMFNEEDYQQLLFLTKIYTDLEIRIYDVVKDEFVCEIKENKYISGSELTYTDYRDEFGLYRDYPVNDNRYLITVGIRSSVMDNIYKRMLFNQFNENQNFKTTYTLIEIDNYEGGKNFARVVKGKDNLSKCREELCSISTTYQDESGRFVFQEMLNSLNETGAYFGYITMDEAEHMVYAELNRGYNLVVITDTSMTDFYSRTMPEFDVFEKTVQNQIRLAMLIASASFLIAILGGVLTFKYMKSKEIENEREQNRIITEHNRVLSRKNDQINQLSHDIKNHLICIKGFINQQMPEVASDYIDSVYEDLNQLSTIVITGNRLVDIILNDKISQMKKMGILFTKQIEEVSFDFIDFKAMTIILTNMLDNAIESCEQSEEKEIHFSISTFNETYIILKVINSCDTAPLVSKGKLQSTKVQKESHGYGVKNIERAIMKYNGEINFDYHEDQKKFSFAIILKKK